MKYRFFTIPVQEPDAAQVELNTFCGSHRIVTVDKHFVADSDRSFWSLCVTYQEKGDNLPVQHT